MLSYQQWKMLNESFAGSITLGLVNPTNLGALNALTLTLDEAKAKKMKKSKKKMDLDADADGDGELLHKGKEPKDEDPDLAPDVDVDGEDMDDDKGGCGGKMCGKNSKKKSSKNSKKKMMKSKKKMWSDSDDEMGGGDADMGDDMAMKSKGHKGGDIDDEDADLEDQEEEEGADLDDDDEEGEDQDHVAKVMGKKKPVPDMGGDMDPDMDSAMGGRQGPMFSKKMSKKMSKKKMKQEAYLDNEEEWMDSVKNMLDPQQSTRKYDDGFSRYYEDALFSPVDPNNLTQAIRPGTGDGNPQPGEVGFAPQQAIGGPLGGGYQEWAKKHK